MSGIGKIARTVIAALTIGVTTLIVDFTVNRTAGMVALAAAVVVVVVVVALWLALPRAAGRSLERDAPRRT